MKKHVKSLLGVFNFFSGSLFSFTMLSVAFRLLPILFKWTGAGGWYLNEASQANMEEGGPCCIYTHSPFFYPILVLGTTSPSTRGSKFQGAESDSKCVSPGLPCSP